jgi:hypothetical protein
LWPCPPRSSAVQVLRLQDTFICMPHVCLPSVITVKRPVEGDDPVQNEQYDYEDPARPLEVSDFAIFPPGLRFITTPIVTTLDTLLADLDELLPSTQHIAPFPLSLQATNCVRHILGQHLSSTRFPFDLSLCERAEELPYVRGFLRLTGDGIERVCPCCNRDSEETAARKWDTTHVGADSRKERLLALLSAGKCCGSIALPSVV